MRAHRGSLLCLLDRRQSPLVKLLQREGYVVSHAVSADRAVAMAAGTHFDAAILDQAMFVETDGWSVAQSLKLVRPGMCVLLRLPAARLSKRMPEGVDAMIPAGGDQQDTLRALRSLLGR